MFVCLDCVVWTTADCFFFCSAYFLQKWGGSLLPALFVNSDRNVTCRYILHAFNLIWIEIQEVMDNMSCMMHLSLCLCFVGMFFFCSFNSM